MTARIVPVMGGRRWTAIATASLLIPAIGIGIAVQDGTTSYPTMLVLALFWVRRGNFSSSMANIRVVPPTAGAAAIEGVALDEAASRSFSESARPIPVEQLLEARVGGAAH